MPSHQLSIKRDGEKINQYPDTDRYDNDSYAGNSRPGKRDKKHGVENSRPGKRYNGHGAGNSRPEGDGRGNVGNDALASGWMTFIEHICTPHAHIVTPKETNNNNDPNNPQVV